jgi:hypothetical protein
VDTKDLKAAIRPYTDLAKLAASKSLPAPPGKGIPCKDGHISNPNLTVERIWKTLRGFTKEPERLQAYLMRNAWENGLETLAVIDHWQKSIDDARAIDDMISEGSPTR